MRRPRRRLGIGHFAAAVQKAASDLRTHASFTRNRDAWTEAHDCWSLVLMMPFAGRLCAHCVRQNVQSPGAAQGGVSEITTPPVMASPAALNGYLFSWLVLARRYFEFGCCIRLTSASTRSLAGSCRHHSHATHGGILVSVHYGTHVRTILLITVNGEGTNAWGRG